MTTIKSRHLNSAIHILDSIPARDVLPSSTTIKVLMEDDRLQMSLRAEPAAIVTLICSVDKKPAEVFIDRASFVSFVSVGEKYKSDVYTAEFGNKQLIIKHGRRKATFQYAAETAGYLEGEMKGGEELPLGLTGLLQVASGYVASDKPELTCVYLSKGRMYASNQVAIFSAECKHPFADGAAIPATAIDSMKLDGLKRLRVRKKDVVMDFSCGFLWHPMSEKARTAFPIKPIRKLWRQAREWPEVSSLKAKRFNSLLDRFSAYLASVDKKQWMLKLTTTQGDSQMLVESMAPRAKFKERVKLESPAGPLWSWFGLWILSCRTSPI